MKFKKLIPLLVVSASLMSCTSYKSKPGKKSHLIGTYELVTYQMQRDEVPEGQEEDSKYDKKAEIGAVAYFSIDADGYGYYGYKDNDTPARVDSIFFSFIYSEKKPDLVEAVNMTDGVTHVYEDHKRPGCLDEPNFGFRDEMFKKTLNYTIHAGHMAFQKDRKIPYRFVEYKKISSDTGLSIVNQRMGTGVSFTKPFEMKAMTGFAVYRCSPRNIEDGYRGIYEYAILNLDSYSSGQIDMVFSLKENPGRQTKKVSLSVSEKGKTMQIDGLGRTFYSYSTDPTKLSVGDFNTKFEEYDETDPYYGESFTKYYGSEYTLDQIIEQELGLQA